MRISLDWLKDFVNVKDGPDKVQHSLTMIGLEVTSILNIDDEQVMDIEITPNRPDCLSILGVARELAAAKDKSLEVPGSVKRHYAKKGPDRGSARVEIQDKKACPRYVGAIIKNVKIGQSPKWLVERLNAMGLRSINNIADATNYVLFELGQPLHAFDLDKLEEKRIIVRKAKKGESIVTIDGVRRELEPGVLVIADAAKPVAIAGIMGGKDTEISDDTKTVLLESAYFDPVAIRRAQRRLGLASESSYRFERGVDFAMILSASARCQEIIKDVAGGRLHGVIADVGGKRVKEKEVVFSLDEIPRILGIDIDRETVLSFFKRLNLYPVKKGKEKILVKIPSYRQDLEKDIDLIEEVARLYGYDRIPVKLPAFTIQKTYEEEQRARTFLEKEAKGILCSLGMDEVITYTLTSRSAIEALGRSFDNVVRLKNPLSANQEFMRPSLLSEMLDVVSWNLNRKNTLLQLFELNKIYLAGKERDIQERLSLCLGMCGTTKGNWKVKSSNIDFFDLKGVMELFFTSLGIKDYVFEKRGSFILKEDLSACIKIGERALGVVGEVRPEIARKFGIKQKVYVAEIDAEDLFKHVNLAKRFRPMPRYPSIKRDISMLVDDSIDASSIFDVIKKVGGEIVRTIDVFDLYKGQQIDQGKKSLAYTLEYRSDEKTLKDEEASEIHKDIQEALVKKLGAQIR